MRRRLLGLALSVLALSLLTGAAQAAGNWTPAVYVQFPDEAAARAAALAIGADFPADGSIPTGDENYALVAPIVERDDGGAPLPGYWAMMRFNLDTAEGAAAYAGLQALGVIQVRVHPNNVFME